MFSFSDASQLKHQHRKSPLVQPSLCQSSARWQSDLPDLREALAEMFNVDKKHGPLHRLEASKLVEVWQQAKARTQTQQKVGSTARAHGMLVELLAGSWGNLMTAFQDQYGSSIPPKRVASSVVL